jgi:hypothetical protein
MTVRRISRLPAVVVGVVFAVLLAGCVDVQFESDFADDGSAVHAFQMTIEREGLEQLESFGGEAEMTFDPEDGREQAEAAGFDFEPIDTDDEVGSRVSKTFDDGWQVGASFDEMLTSTADEGAALPVGAVTGTLVEEDGEYRLNLTIDSDILFAETPASGEDAEEVEDMGFGSMESFFDITYTATLPGEISETNGTDLGDGKVEWELPLTGTTELTAVSEEGSDSSGGLLIIGGLIVLLLLGGVAGVFLLTRRRTSGPATSAGSFNPSPSVAPAGSYGANPPPLTESGMTPDRPSHEQDTTRLP